MKKKEGKNGKRKKKKWTKKCNTIQYETIQYKTIQNKTIQYKTNMNIIIVALTPLSFETIKGGRRKMMEKEG